MLKVAPGRLASEPCALAEQRTRAAAVHSTPMRLALLLAGLLLVATGCPPNDRKGAPSSSSASTSPSSACTKFGQSCEVSPGKLGTCVRRDDCADPTGCFVCQSQH